VSPAHGASAVATALNLVPSLVPTNVTAVMTATAITSSLKKRRTRTAAFPGNGRSVFQRLQI
jgi:hypothetical protein